MRLPTSLVVLCASLHCQQTWVVDPNGTGNFTNLMGALQVAVAGDIVVLRGGGDQSGSYTITQPIHLVGESPRTRIAHIVASVPLAGPPLTVSGVGINQFQLSGRVTVEDVASASLSVSNAVATFTRCTLGGGNDLYGQFNTLAVSNVANSRVVFEQCTMASSVTVLFQFGHTCYPTQTGCPALVLTQGSNADVTNSVLTGVDGLYCSWINIYWPPDAAVAVDSTSRVRFTHGSVACGVPYPGGQSVAPVRFANGAWVFADLSTQFNPPLFPIRILLPATGGQGAAPGGTMTCRLDGPPQLPAVLAASVGARSPTTLPEGEIWIDLAAFVILRLAPTDTSGALTATISVPPGIGRGLPLTIQGAVLPTGSFTLAAAAPAVLLVL